MREIVGEDFEMRKRGFWRTILTAFCLVSLAIITVLFWIRYDLHPSKVENPDNIVSNAMANALGEEYNDRDIVTRQEAIQIVFEVLFKLRQEGFEAVDTAPEVISQAIVNGMLEGDESGQLHLDDPTTRQESLTFIARGLKLSAGEDTEIRHVFEDDNLIADWARADIDNLIHERYISSSKIGDFLRPNDNITPTELKGFLDGVVTIKTKPISFPMFIYNYWNDYPLLSMGYKVFTAFLAIVPLAFEGLAQLENISIEKRKKGTICIAGAQNVGKTTLMNRFKNRYGPISDFLAGTTQAGTGESEHVKLSRENGDVIFDGQIIDVPGSQMERAITFLASRAPNKTLLLILAHTKGSDSDEIDNIFLDMQRMDIERFWTRELRAHGDSLNQIVIFINKIDLLAMENRTAESRIYKQHINLICKDNENLKKRIRVIEGSCASGVGLDKLYTQLDPVSFARGNWPKIKLPSRLKGFFAQMTQHIFKT